MTAIQRIRPAGHGVPPDPGLLDLVACGVLLVDGAGTVTYANPAAADLLSLRDDHGPLATVAAAALAPAPDGPGGPATVVEIGAGRALECLRRPLGDGGSVLTLVDVSPQLRALQLARHDPLTGLANRSELRERLAAALAEGRALAVLCLDLDRFKAVNDTLGHPMGDALLRKVADRLRGTSREGDAVARMGGDEFTVLQAGATAAGAAALAERLVDLLGRAYLLDGHAVNVGASVGVALFPDDGAEPDDLLKKADLALYAAKADGRGTHRRFEPGMEDRLRGRRALEIELRKALALREFQLAFQPQVALATGQVCGFEALIRWANPRLGAVAPTDFIPLAEELGLIVPIGEWVLRTACREAAAWPDPVWVAVNLSPVQFRSPRLVDAVAAALHDTGLDPSRLELEITEGTLMDDTDAVLGALGRLRAMGVRVGMDDFGTGYSSLATLQRFPFDRLKIDRSFVSGAAAEGNPAILRAIAGLGASLGMRTTAEGVETDAQLARIRAEGCTEVQGFLLGRPVPPAEAAAMIAPPTIAPPTIAPPGTAPAGTAQAGTAQAGTAQPGTAQPGDAHE